MQLKTNDNQIQNDAINNFNTIISNPRAIKGLLMSHKSIFLSTFLLNVAFSSNLEKIIWHKQYQVYTSCIKISHLHKKTTPGRFHVVSQSLTQRMKHGLSSRVERVNRKNGIGKLSYNGISTNDRHSSTATSLQRLVFLSWRTVHTCTLNLIL